MLLQVSSDVPVGDLGREGLRGPFLLEFWLRILLIRSFVFKSKIISEILWQPGAVCWLWGPDDISMLSFPPVASHGRRLAPELLAGSGSTLVPTARQDRLMGIWEENTLHQSSGAALSHCSWKLSLCFLSRSSPRKGHGSSSFVAREIPLKQSVLFLLLRLT